jgi:hypothetical protein
MSDKFTWAILNLCREKTTGAVVNIQWSYSGLRDTENGTSYFTVLEGSVGLESPDTGSFIPYDDITEEIAINWTKEYLTKDNANKLQELESLVTERLNELENPTILLGKPWETPPEEPPLPVNETTNTPPGDGQEYTWSARDQAWILTSEFVPPA